MSRDTEQGTSSRNMAKAEKLEEALTTLREQIIRGDYGIRGYLPSRSILEREFGISHSVMNQVILQLQGEGLIASNDSLLLRREVEFL
jgi:DNA-binding GntR family transcriptional regulator